MTSEQVMLSLAVLWVGGCSTLGYGRKPAPPLPSPYEHRRVLAVAPLRNESGSLMPDGAAMADHLANHLENASNVDVLAVNRTIRAMRALGLSQISSQAQAMQVMKLLNADGLVVGSITAWDPYDPPKLGLALELYDQPPGPRDPPLDVRALSRAATGDQTLPPPSRATQPVTVVSAFLDAADPTVRSQLEHYAYQRGPERNEQSPVSYRISMDLYSEYVSYVMCWRLLQAEAVRLAPLARVEPSP